MAHSDEELMSLVRNDNVSAFERLLDRYERRVFAFFCRLMNDSDRAADYTQEIFLRLWKNRGRYSPSGRFSTYLFQIAKHYFLNEAQKQRSRLECKGALIPETEGQRCEGLEGQDGLQRLLARELQGAISSSIARLPEALRMVYVLSEEHRMPYRDIAEILNCPLGTVSSRKCEAVKKLRQWLAPLKDELLDRSETADRSA